jgi:hypothetical protein
MPPSCRVSDEQRVKLLGMTTATEAIQRMAEVTGLLPATVSRTARALREKDVRLWPQGAQGRGQAAHVEGRHLINLLIALAMGLPVEAPVKVQRYRELADESGVEFGQYCDDLLDQITPDSDSSGLELAFIDLQLGEAPGAFVWQNSVSGPPVLSRAFQPRQNLLLNAIEPPNHRTGLIHRVRISLELFVVLAALWRGTKTHRAIRDVHANGGKPAGAPLSRSDALASSPSGDENAAPGRTVPTHDQDQKSIP